MCSVAVRSSLICLSVVPQIADSASTAITGYRMCGSVARLNQRSTMLPDVKETVDFDEL